MVMDTSQSNISATSFNEDSLGSGIKGSTRKGTHYRLFRDRAGFFKDLFQFHENKGTTIPRYPQINGIEIDLHQLYQLVTNRGGCTKVNYRNEWEEIFEEFKLPKKCVNASVGIKQIYTRYLERYEKQNFVGDDNERNDDGDDDNRHKKWNNKIITEIPLKYNYAQHNVTDHARILHKLSTDFRKISEYDKLFMSLMSPLPNEQDFAINVCTLMANESKHTLKIERCPKLLDSLLAHAGVFSHSSLRDLFVGFYAGIRHQSIQRFWNNGLYDKSMILELSYDDYFETTDRGPVNHRTFDYDNLEKENLIDGQTIDPPIGSDFLNYRNGLGTHDYIGQRVHQIASILRNLSFIDENIHYLVKNRTFIRFLIMCSNIRWNNLHHMGLDMLGNVAAELELSDPSIDDLTRCLLTTISDGIECQDRGVIISSLEILYKLCQKECNEEPLQKSLHKETVKQMCLFLSLNDIMLLLYTLECIYALTSLGERTCLAVIQVRGIVDTLVALVTVEAQSYGPDGCILMRVVETVPTNVAPTIAPVQNNITAVQLQPVARSSFDLFDSNSNSSVVTSLAPPDPLKLTTLTQQSQKSPQPLQPVVVVSQPIKQQQQQQLQPIIKPSPQQIQLNKGIPQQVIIENEQYATAWLRANFEHVLAVDSRIEQHDLYKMYVGASTKTNRTSVLSPNHFPAYVRKIFGDAVGPNQRFESGGGDEQRPFCYEGIRIKGKPMHRPNVEILKGTSTPTYEIQSTEVVTTTPSIGKPSSPTADSVVIIQKTAPIPSQNIKEQTTATGSMVTTIGGGSVIQTSTSTTQSSFIKSLLANKVTPTDCPTVVTAAGDATINATTTNINQSNACVITTTTKHVNVQQVAQRQHMQKQKEIAQQYSATTSTSNIQTTIIPAGITIKSTKKLPQNIVTAPVATVLQKKEFDASSNTNAPVPPLAPLSGGPSRTANYIPSAITYKLEDDTDSMDSVTSSTSSTERTSLVDDTENSFTGFEGLLIPNQIKLDDGKHVITANKMLTDLLERKASEPRFVNQENPLKRRGDQDTIDSMSPKRQTGEEGDPIEIESSLDDDELDSPPKLPSSNAANLYAKLAASLLEDEDMDDDDVIMKEEEPVPQPIIEQAKQVINVPVPIQRQLIMGTNNSGQQVILGSTTGGQSISGQTTVPFVLQHGSGPGTVANIQLPKQFGQTGQIMQPVIQQPTQTQYVLATNQQGQTYLVAQPQTTMNPHQTVLLQTQQAGNQTKTIIILQQQAPQPGQSQTGQILGTVNAPVTPQKVIMTTQQGQQMIVTQVPRPVQHHVIMNHPMSTTGSTMIQTGPQQITGSTPIMQTVQQQNVQPATIQQQIVIQSQQQQQPQPTLQQQQHQQQQRFIQQQNKSQPIIQKQVVIQQPISSPVSSETYTPKLDETVKKPIIEISAIRPIPEISIPPPQSPIEIIKLPDDDLADPSWLYQCDWRYCTRKKFKSLNETFMHMCQIHCPENIDPNAEIYCQCGPGPNYCDNIPRKRFSLMTHIQDRHCTMESFKQAAQRRTTSTPSVPVDGSQQGPVTVIKNLSASVSESNGTASPALSTSSGNSALVNASAAMQAIKRHSFDLSTMKEIMDENEGPVTKSIRLTAALILRNLVVYSTTAKRNLRYYEPHLAGIALSNVESSRTIAQVLYEMNDG